MKIVRANEKIMDNLQIESSVNDSALRRDIPENNRLLFMHIPKTAGSSLNAIIGAQYPVDRSILHAENIILGKRQDEIDDLEKYKFISAHLKIDTLKKFVDIKRYFSTTILRDPIKQTVSHLAWVSRLTDPEYKRELNSLPSHIKHIVERINSVDIVEFIDTFNQKEKNLFDNCQTRYFLPFHGDVDITDMHMADALGKLNAFDAIGLTERFSESLLIFAFYMGWKPLKGEKKLNISNRRFSIDFENADDEVKTRIRKITKYDSVLYRQANIIFERQIRKMLTIIRNQYPELVKKYISDENMLNINELAQVLGFLEKTR